MLDYQKYLMRYGEHGVQAIVENIERNEGIRHKSPLSLEIRWNKVMKDEKFEQSAMAA
jgi:hypothetical protein